MAKRKNLNDLKKAAVIRHLLAGSKDGVLKRGACKAAAEEFGCELHSIKRLWRKFHEQHQAGVAHAQLANGRKGKSGRKGIPIEELRARLRDISLNDRTTQRRLAPALGIPKATLHNNLKALGLRAHSNALKLYLAAGEGQGSAA